VTGEKPSAKVAGYVLGGGASSRFGQDKALVQIGGKPMLIRMHELLGNVATEVQIVAAQGKYAHLGADVVADRWPREGPLGGIITALMNAHTRNHRHPWCLIIGCDMPFLTSEWLAYMVERALVSGAGVITPQSPHGLEPLCACWHTRATGKLQYAFEDGVRKITDAMKHLDMEVLDDAHWKRFDSAGRLFWNMNTPADYDEAKRILEAQRA
jgi:molybdenum cofactor guanylyltransferase